MPRASQTKAAGGTSKRSTKQKQIQVVASIGSDGSIQGSFVPEPRRPLIAHLPFRSTEVDFTDNMIGYDPRPPPNPEPYDAGADDIFTSGAEQIEANHNEVRHELPPAISESQVLNTPSQQVIVTQEEKPIKAFQTIETLVEYKHMNESRCLPTSVNAACFWCAGSFEGRPVVIPTLEEQGVYKVYGNFCTLPCAHAYLLQEHIDPQVRWERSSLLHRMYKQLSPVHPAPPRESLQLFGGSLTHDQYRSIIEKKQIRIDSHLPPVISILSTLDTKPIDFYETSFRNTTASLESMKSQEPGLRLKRSKPLKDKESTLDAVMNLQVRSRA